MDPFSPDALRLPSDHPAVVWNRTFSHPAAETREDAEATADVEAEEVLADILAEQAAEIEAEEVLADILAEQAAEARQEEEFWQSPAGREHLEGYYQALDKDD
jgi:hypothetical protein